jgi:hypothetical protein
MMPRRGLRTAAGTLKPAAAGSRAAGLDLTGKFVMG